MATGGFPRVFFFFFLRPGAGGALIVLIEFDSSSSRSSAPNDLFLSCLLVKGIHHNQDTAWDRRRGAAG